MCLWSKPATFCSAPLPLQVTSGGSRPLHNQQWTDVGSARRRVHEYKQWAKRHVKPEGEEENTPSTSLKGFVCNTLRLDCWSVAETACSSATFPTWLLLFPLRISFIHLLCFTLEVKVSKEPLHYMGSWSSHTGWTQAEDKLSYVTCQVRSGTEISADPEDKTCFYPSMQLFGLWPG